MRIRALFLLSILTFGCLSEAQPTPGGIKDSLTLAVVALRAVAQLYLRQNTRTILQQEVSSAARAMMPRSPFHAAGSVHSSVMAHLQPPLIRTGLGALLQARPVHTSTTMLTASSRLNAASNSNQGGSDQNIQPDDESARLTSELEQEQNLRLLEALGPTLNAQWGTNYHSLDTFLPAWRSYVGGEPNPPPAFYGELALVATALGNLVGRRGSIAQAASPWRHEELLTDDTQRAATIYAYFNSVMWGGGVNLVTMARYLCLEPFPENQRFNLSMGDYGPSHSALLQNLSRGLQDNSIQSPGDVLDLSANSISPGQGSWGNGGFMGIVPIVSVVDLRPEITDEFLVSLTRDTVRVTHNHPHSVAAATAITLAARSSIDYLQSSRRGQRPSRLEFAEATIARIRQHVQDDQFLHYLRIVEQNLDGSYSHGSVMSQLNRAPSGQAATNDEGILTDMRAPNTAVTALYFFLTETESQQPLINLVEQYTEDRDTVGILMALSVLRDGGIRRDEFSADELGGLLGQFPEWVKIRRDPDLFLIDPPANNEGGIRQDEPSVGGTNLLDYGPD